jgi:non-canonical (house-cleaning) NTP pyrophosphatase
MESGLVSLRGAGWFNVVVCAVFDGYRLHWGIGPGFALPDRMARLAARGELGDVIDRWTGAKLSKRRGGAIAALTGGRIARGELLEQAALMALASLEQLSLA